MAKNKNNNNNNNRCVFCKRKQTTFGSKYAKDRHLRFGHKALRDWKDHFYCLQCDIEFARNDNRLRHNRKFH